MRMNPNNIIPIGFEEHPVKDIRAERTSAFDVTAEGMPFSADLLLPENFSSRHYCYCLLHKIQNLSTLELEPFLTYQLHQMRDADQWLRQLEVLVEVNVQFFDEVFFRELQQLIRKLKGRTRFDTEDKLAATIKNFFNQRYNLDKVREHLKKLDSYEAKLDYLFNLKIDFIRHRPRFLIIDDAPFDQLLDLEIKKIEKLQKRMKHPLPKTEGHPPVSQKCETSLTVSQLAYQFRVLYDIGLFPVRTKTALFKTISQVFTTPNQKNISWKSFKNSFDNPDPNAVDFWISKFQHLALQAKREKEK